MELSMKPRGESTRERILDAAKKLVMEQGFAGTSIDQVLNEAGVTKGAFFHQAQSDDPLEQVMIFLKLFEIYISNSEDPAPGCMYAVYTYESRQFDPDVLDFVSDTLRQWTSIYVRKFQEVIDRYAPALPVTARQLAEMIVSVIEGGLVLQRAHGDTGTTRRQSEQFRNYLTLLFPGAASSAAA
jgi:TetR/AcrR family transcriptional repressor of nem operon